LKDFLGGHGNATDGMQMHKDGTVFPTDGSVAQHTHIRQKTRRLADRIKNKESLPILPSQEISQITPTTIPVVARSRINKGI